MIHDFIEEMSGKRPLLGVDVDEAVSLGAAIRANINEDGKYVVEHGETTVRVQGAKSFTDVTAHALGMVALSEDGEKFENSVIIPKNTKIPAQDSRPFKIKTRAAEYGENELEIFLLQGDYPRPLDNTIISKYTVKNIEFLQPPESVINVTYRYDANGIIEVSAVQSENNKQLDIVIHPVPDDMGWTDEAALSMRKRTVRPNSIEAVVCIDLSGSMAGAPTKAAQEAVRNFAAQLYDGDIPVKVGVVAFADEINVLCEPEDIQKIFEDKIDMLPYTSVGAGNNADPFDTARKIFKGADVSYIVIVTDGVWADPAKAIANANDCKKAGVDVLALGFGDADERFLQSIATVKEFASYTKDHSELTASFDKIAQVIGGEGI
jgi:uncharacterized protein YegL